VKNVLFLAPHLSTGGLPQYLYTKIDRIKSSYNIYVCMWNNIAPIYDVQFKRIQSIIPNGHLFFWPQNEQESVKIDSLPKMLESIDVVHIEEFPETFLPNEVIDLIYSQSRQYNIIETSHNSNFKPERKRTLPDAFVFVSNVHARRFQHFNIPTTIVEYPIENYIRPERTEALASLGLDPGYKHVLNVGLFTPGKNQSEVFDIARMLNSHKILFHFIGNQASNFEDYWKPLMEDKPSNCIIHGERHDVDKWYAACDLLLFPSKSELNPLVPREALSWHMPILMYNLPIYEGSYNKYNEIAFLDRDVHKNAQKVLSKLGFQHLSRERLPRIKMVHLLTRPDDERERASVQSLSELKSFGIDYIQHVNEPCTEYPIDKPPINSHAIKKPGYYGAYTSFRKAIETEFSENIDFFMICECDCVLTVSHNEFMTALMNVCNTIDKNDIYYFSLGPNGENGMMWSSKLEELDDFSYITNKIILAHCIIFPKRARKFLLSRCNEIGWDSPDIWLNHVFMNQRKIGIVNKPLAVQHEGMSLIDLELKSGGSRIQTQTFDIDNDMESLLERVYDYTEIKRNKNPLTYNVNFVNGAFLEVLGRGVSKYTLEALDEQQLVYADELSPNHYIRTSRKWYTKWTMRVSKNNEILFEHKINLNNKNVYISFDSKSLGDSIAWIPYVEEFRKKHNCNIICSTFWNNLFKDIYPEIHFVKPGKPVSNIYAMYTLCYSIPFEPNRNPQNPITIPLQQVATDILGLEYKEIRPNIEVFGKGNIKGNYICIGLHSTAQCKYWNCPNGWQKVVDYCKGIGYKVVLISQEGNNYMGNKHPTGVIDKSGKIPIENRMIDLKHAKCFIGIGSGLSWLAWAIGTPTILISGFSEPYCEFHTNVERLINESVCHGCFNDTNFIFDRSNWNWCPRNKNFECSKSITPESVIERLEKILKTLQ
jgi:autotransporter strand-loop-strand O-heptosyltransferase